MTKETLSEKYTKALILLEEGEHDSLNAFEVILECFKIIPSFYELLFSPLISKNEKKELIDFSFGLKVNTRLLNLLFLLIDKNSISLLPDIAAGYKKRLLEEKSTLEITVKTPFTLDESAMKTLKNYCENSLHRTVLLKEQINPKMIGGVMLSFNNQIFNCSIRERLSKLKTSITEAL